MLRRSSLNFWQNEGYKLDIPAKKKERKLLAQRKKDTELEKAFLTAEAEENGTLTYSADPKQAAASVDIDEQDLLTVRTGGGKKGKDPKKKKKKKTPTKSKLQQQAEAITAKQENNPEYVPTTKEFMVLKRWNAEQLKRRKQEVEKGKKALTKKSKAMQRRRTAKTSVPRSTQQSIPYIADFEEGLFEVTPNKFSKMYRIKDINYTTVKEEEQIAIF